MPDSPIPTSSGHVTPQLLAQLAAITGSEFHYDRACVAVQNAAQAGNDPLDQLVSSAAEVSMHVSPMRMPLVEAIWQAHHDTPVVIWHPQESRWLVITYAAS